MRNGSFRQKVFKLSFPKHQQFIGRMLKWLNEGKMDCVNNSNTIGALNSLFFEVASANNRQISFNMREKIVCTRQKWFRPLSPFSVCVCVLSVPKMLFIVATLSLLLLYVRGSI